MISTRAVRQIELQTISDEIDWGQLVPVIERKKHRVGRPRKYSRLDMLKVVILQDLEGIEDDTEMARRLKVNIHYRDFCGFIQNTPSHDRLSDFKRETPARVWRKIFYTLDAMLEEKGYFDGSDYSIDGTAIELDKKAVPGSWGATSANEKFYGLWLLTCNSTTRELVRDFVLDEAKVGQIKPGLKLLDKLANRDLQGIDISADGIFDTREFRRKIVELNKVPVIPYNPRKSKIKKAEELPDDNWRLEYTPFLKDAKEFNKRYRPRTASERENSRIKLLTLVGSLKEKTKSTPHMTENTVNSRVVIGLISLQCSAMAQYTIECRMTLYTQVTLKALA